MPLPTSTPIKPVYHTLGLLRIPSLLITFYTILAFRSYFSVFLSDNAPRRPFDTMTFVAYLVGIASFMFPTASDLLELLLYLCLPPITNQVRYLSVSFLDALALPFLIAASTLVSFSGGAPDESRRVCVELFMGIIIFRVLFITSTYLFNSLSERENRAFERG